MNTSSIKLLLVLFFGLFIFTSCDNTLELAEDKKEVPVVYGMLDFDAEYQYIRVERAFVSNTTSALELAKNPDSLYYKNAVVKLKRIRSGASVEKVLTEVDGKEVGYPREDGVFATEPNILYRISKADLELKPGDDVSLTIEINENLKVTANTKIIDKVRSSVPSLGSSVDFPAVAQSSVRWNLTPTNAGSIFSSRYVLHIIEEQGGVEKDVTLNWVTSVNSESTNIRLEPGTFYTLLANNLKKDASIKRYFNTVDFYVDAGDESFTEFILINQANNGITSSGEIPVYSNISGGVGIFGSKSTLALEGLGLNNKTNEELLNNALTKDLNFQ